jgi:segregation and condensation protein B
MELRLEKETALIEAILYLETDPIDEHALVRVTGLDREVVDRAIEALTERYAKEDSGVELSRIGGSLLIAPKKEYWDALRERYGKKNESKLSKAAMETLSIIAYSQPITRGEVEAIRGVSADNMIRLLFDRELIREVGKKDVLGKPVQYGTTKEFLTFFRIGSLAELPKLDESESERFELNG